VLSGEEDEPAQMSVRRTTRKEMWRNIEQEQRRSERQGYTPSQEELLQFRNQLRSKPSM
jgi:hypothetical protein